MVTSDLPLHPVLGNVLVLQVPLDLDNKQVTLSYNFLSVV